MGWLITALGLYIVWYLYRSVRRVYGRAASGRLEMRCIGSAYFFCGLVTFALTTVYSAATL